MRNFLKATSGMMRSCGMGLIVSICFFSIQGCKKDKDKSSTVKVSATAVHSSNYNPEFTTVYYTGDTIKYTLKVSASEDVTELTITHNGSDVISPVTSFSNPKSFTFDFTYIVQETAGQSCVLEVVTKEGSDKSKASNQILSFTVSALEEKTFRLYNKECGYSKDSLIKWLRFPTSKSSLFPDQVKLINHSEVLMNDFSNDYLVIAATHSDYFYPANTQKQFQHIFFNDRNSSSFINRVIKVNSAFTSINMPASLIQLYNSNIASLIAPNTNYGINEISVSDNDVYIMRSDIGTTYKASYMYSVILIDEIMDDNLTSTTGGNDLDYIQFKIKYCSANRF